MKKKILFTQEDIINALEDYAIKNKQLDSKEKLETINYNYDRDNNVISIEGVQQ